MKAILTFIVFVAIGIASGGCTREQAEATEATIQVPTVQCNMCVAKIEKAIGKLDGVQSVSVDLDEKRAMVQYVSAKLTMTQIESAIADAGYDANDIRRNEEAYKNLPACCQ